MELYEDNPLPSDQLVSRAVARAQAGDRDALRLLYTRFAGDVERFVLGLVRDPHDAEDITQNVFAKLMRVIGQYEERQVPFGAWILRVARNTALDHLRAKRQIPVAEVYGRSQPAETVGRERSESLKTALSQLPEAQREVLVLQQIAGMTPAEIAEHTGKSRGSVHALHHRGRVALRAALEDLDAAPKTAA